MIDVDLKGKLTMALVFYMLHTGRLNSITIASQPLIPKLVQTLFIF